MRGWSTMPPGLVLFPRTYGERSIGQMTPDYSGNATVDLISSIERSAVTLWTFTSDISA